MNNVAAQVQGIFSHLSDVQARDVVRYIQDNVIALTRSAAYWTDTYTGGDDTQSAEALAPIDALSEILGSSYDEAWDVLRIVERATSLSDYAHVGLSADWSYSAWQIDADTIILQNDDDSDNFFEVIRYREFENAERKALLILTSGSLQHCLAFVQQRNAKNKTSK